MTASAQLASAPSPSRRSLPLLAALIGLTLALPWLGRGGTLAAVMLGGILIGTPLFALIGLITILCFWLWAGFDSLDQYSVLIERIRTLADNPSLLAIPLFMASGNVMSRGQISQRLVRFAQALVGWLPGGLAISAVLACVLFAAISGSSPATVVAIGGMMGPALLREGYAARFSHGLLTSAGSLGILIPPSIPMILYPIVNQRSFIEVERLFMAGVGPGIVIGVALGGLCVINGLRDGTPRPAFDKRELLAATRDGIWALMFPGLVLGGIYSGVFNAVEAAGISVVYAVVVEVWVHRALQVRQLPTVMQETGLFLGSLLVIMVAALAFNEFLEGQRIPHMAVEWIRSLELAPWQFMVLLNLLLLLVGTVMDILSAMMVFVPLLAPMASAMGIDPIHFGIIFIVNLEIGYLTPPVGLNLFVASTLFQRPLGHVIRSVAPFIVAMLGALAAITYEPALSVGLASYILDGNKGESPSPAAPSAEPDPTAEIENPSPGRVMTLEEMMQAATQRETEDRDPPTPQDKPVMTLEEMMREAERRQQAPPEPEPPPVGTARAGVQENQAGSDDPDESSSRAEPPQGR